MMFHTILLVSYNGTQIHILHALKDIALYKRIRLLELSDKILHLYTLRCILTATGCTGISEFACTLDKMQIVIISPLLDIIYSDKIQRTYQLHTFKIRTVQLRHHCLYLCSI